MSKIWVYSATGRPVHLVDKDVTTTSGDYFRLSIDKRMAENQISVEVEETDLIDNAINIHKILKTDNNDDAARKKSEKYWAQVKIERDAQAAVDAEVGKASTDISKVVQELVEKQLNDERKKLEIKRPMATEVTAPKPVKTTSAKGRKPRPVKVS